MLAPRMPILIAGAILQLALATLATAQQSSPSANVGDLRAIAAARGQIRVVAQLNTVDPRPIEAAAAAAARSVSSVQRPMAGVPQFGFFGGSETVARVASAAEQASAAAAQTANALSERLKAVANAPSIAHIEGTPLVVASVDQAGLDALVGSGQVARVFEDFPMASHLAQSLPMIKVTQAWSNGFTGAGRIVAVIDTGADSTHAFLTGKIVREACFSTTFLPQSARSLCRDAKDADEGPGAASDCPSTVSGCGHGTHVAGIIAGNAVTHQGKSLSGVAPDARLVVIKAYSRFDNPALCDKLPSPCALVYWSDMLRALRYIASLPQDVPLDAVNISAGSGAFATACDAADAMAQLKTSVDQLRSRGVPTIVSAGNDRSSTGIAQPACISTVVAVGGETRQGAIDTSYSNSNKLVRLVAPGTVVSSHAGGFAELFGTSMAAPHVAGAWAALKSRHPNASVEEILGALQITGPVITDARNQLKFRGMNVIAAGQLLGAY